MSRLLPLSFAYLEKDAAPAVMLAQLQAPDDCPTHVSYLSKLP